MIAAWLASAFLLGFVGGWVLLPGLAVGATVYWVIGQNHGRVVVLMIVLAALGAWRAPDTDEGNSIDLRPGDQIRADVISAVIDDGRSQRLKLNLDGGFTICARTFARTDLGRGDVLIVDLELDDESDFPNSYIAYLKSQRCHGSGTLSQITVLKSGSGIQASIDQIRESAAEQLVTWVPGDKGALLAGLVIGDDSLLADDTADAFVETGTYHVVAISGANLSLLASLLLIASAWSYRRRLTSSIALIAIWGYVLIGGAGPPTLRAGMLATAATASRQFGRPPDLLTLSLQIAALQAAIWPNSAIGLSYRLTTVAILGVLIASAGRNFETLLSSIKLSVVATIVVNFALMPILPESSRASPAMSIVANTVIAPIVSIAFVLGLIALGLSLIFPEIGELIAVLAGQTCGLIIAIVETIAGWDWLPAPLTYNGSTLPQPVLVAMAIGVALFFSKEFRRTIPDLKHHWRTLEPNVGYLLFGVGSGIAVAAPIVLLLKR